MCTVLVTEYDTSMGRGKRIDRRLVDSGSIRLRGAPINYDLVIAGPMSIYDTKEQPGHPH